MYSISFSVFGAHYLIADQLRMTLVSPITGQPIKSALLGDTSNPNGIININKLNNFQNQLNTTKSFNPINAITTTYSLAWDLFLLIIGYYIFNFLILFGISYIIVVPMIFIYTFFLGRAVLALVRGY